MFNVDPSSEWFRTKLTSPNGTTSPVWSLPRRLPMPFHLKRVYNPRTVLNHPRISTCSSPISVLYMTEKLLECPKLSLNGHIWSSPRSKLPFEPLGFAVTIRQACGLTLFDPEFATSRVIGFSSHFNSKQTEPVNMFSEDCSLHYRPDYPFSLPQLQKLIRVLNLSQPPSKFSCSDLQGCCLQTNNQTRSQEHVQCSPTVWCAFRQGSWPCRRSHTLIPWCCNDSPAHSRFILWLTFSGNWRCIIHWAREHNTYRVNDRSIISISNRKKHFSCGLIRFRFVSGRWPLTPSHSKDFSSTNLASPANQSSRFYPGNTNVSYSIHSGRFKIVSVHLYITSKGKLPDIL